MFAQPSASLDQARLWMDESRAFRKAGRYDEALGLAEKARAVRERALGADDPALADALHLVALILDDKGEYAKAEPISRRALAIREKSLGPEHPDVAQSLVTLAWTVKARQDFAGAESLYRRALEIQERALGADAPVVASTLNDLAILYNQTGRYEEALTTHRRALVIRERAGDGDGVGLSLNNLARVQMNLGDYDGAAETYRRALSNWEAAVGPDHPRVANALDGLAQAAAASGDYATAEPLQLRVLAIREKALGPDHPEVGTTLNNLAVIYREKGDLERAVPLLLRDLALTEARLGPDHSFVAPTLSNLALIDQQRHDYARAEARFRRALSIQEQRLGRNHLAVGVTLSRLGRLYVEDPSKGAAEAEALLQRALTTLEAAVGASHPEVAAALTALATLRDRQGNDAASEALLRRALETQEAVLGSPHPDLARSLERIAALRERADDAPAAVAHLARAYDIRERLLARNLPLGSDRQRVIYLTLFARDTDRAVSLHVRTAPASPEALDLAFTTVLRRKGRALDAAQDSVAVLRQHAAESQRVKFDRLSVARAQLAAVTLRGPAGARPAAYRANLRRLEERVDRLEADLSAESAAFRADSSPISIAAVQQAIPQDAVLIEYAAYRPPAPAAGAAAPPRFVAYVLASNTGPHWVDLGDADAIDAAVERWRAALRNPRREDADRHARALHRLVLEPIGPLLRDATHLLIAPDGALNLIPFAALRDDRPRYLIDRYTVTLLTSGRDLLRLQVPRASRREAVVVAAPAFGEPALATASTPAAGERPRVVVSRTFFGPLPGATAEVRALRALLPAATVLTGPQASESAVRRLSGPRLLHIATHGFFRDREPAAAGAAAVDNPLLRSGLALAGANQGGQPDDGILTALEAAGLDLWGTRLVVLSACDTGVGDVSTGDGVYGLRRAFVLAGAESQLMSLWPVSDTSTRELMIRYYREVTSGAGRAEALRRAQTDLRKNPRYAHPYYWASFIQIGAWRSLQNDVATN